MATFVLSVAGSIVGGPIGGALGSMIGAYIDSQFLFAQHTRTEGPRLDDVPLSPAAESSPIPRVLGSSGMRVGCTLMAAGDLIEVQSSETHRAGKGGGGSKTTVTTYSYFRHCAYLIGEGEITGVGRIWADDLLIYDRQPLTGIPAISGAGIQGPSGVRWDGNISWAAAVPPGTAATMTGGDPSRLIGQKLRIGARFDATIAAVYSWRAGLPADLPGHGLTEIWRYEESDPDDEGGPSLFSTYGTFGIEPISLVDVTDEIRIYTGADDQLPDALLEEISDDGFSPGYRGLAYVVLERLALADFGNRLPTITVEAEGQVGTSTVAGALDRLLDDAGIPAERRAVDGFGGAVLKGGAVSPGSVMDGVTALLSMVDGVIRQRGGIVEVLPRESATRRALGGQWLGASAGGRVSRWSPARVTDESGLPAAVIVQYADQAKQYERGSQMVRRANVAIPASRTTQTIAMDRWCMESDTASAIASRALYRQWIERETGRLSLPPAYMDVESSDILTLPWQGQLYTLRVTRRARRSDWTVELECVVMASVPDPQAAAAGYVRDTAPYNPPIVILTILQLPPLATDQVASPGYLIAMRPFASTDKWAGATLMTAPEGSSDYIPLLTVPYETHAGRLVTGLPAGPRHIWDLGNSVDVVFERGPGPSSLTEEQVLAGANALLIDDEILQWLDAVLVDDRTWRLSTLLRGRRGTWPAAHDTDATAIILGDGLIWQAIEPAAIGRPLNMRALPSGGKLDQTAISALTPIARNLLPLAPCHLIGERLSTGDIRVTWTRRDRAPWRLFNGATPMSETSERYRLAIMDGATEVRVLDVTGPAALYTGAQQTADFGGAAPAITIQVQQWSAVVGWGDAETSEVS